MRAKTSAGTWASGSSVTRKWCRASMLKLEPGTPGQFAADFVANVAHPAGGVDSGCHEAGHDTRGAAPMLDSGGQWPKLLPW